jgi:hypothetical protein
LLTWGYVKERTCTGNCMPSKSCGLIPPAW